MALKPWYLARHGRRIGPLATEELAANGLRPGRLVWRPGLADWTPAEALPELRPWLAAAPESLGPAVAPPGWDVYRLLLICALLLDGLSWAVLRAMIGPDPHLDFGLLLPLILAGLGFSAGYGVFAYRAWGALRPNGGRTEPGLAVLLLFVPLFNFYWIFVVLLGLVRASNARDRVLGLDRRGGRRPLGRALPVAVGLAYVVQWAPGSCSLIWSVPALALHHVLLLVLAYKLTERLNHPAPGRSPSAGEDSLGPSGGPD
ncbi:MAG: DUF4339 domain-containing protein [Desulfovibrionaceae bacterium]